MTGGLPTISRDEAKKLIRDAGGNISTSVSSKTDFVVAGEDPGTKFDKAIELGVEILNEEEFLKIMK